jgi:glycosyltransferase involved in cell wall biosynthesis
MNYLVAVDYCFLDMPGGMGRVAWDIAELARDQGHDVAMLCYTLPGKGEPRSTAARHEGIQIVRYPKPRLPGWHPRRDERTIAAAAQAVREHLGDRSWDVVHIHSAFTGAGAMRALGDRPRYLYTMHSPIALEQKFNWAIEGWTGRLKLMFGVSRLAALEGKLMKACSDIHTLSEFSRDWVEHYHGLGDRVAVIPHWRRSELVRTMTKAEARRRLGWPEDEPTFFTVRVHGPRYGLDVAIQAIAPLAVQRMCRFVVGGDGALRPALIELASSLGAGEQIIFPGRLSDEELILAYQAADAFILPTLALECFGLISIESLSFGCPVIATRVGAIPEVLTPILPDCLVPPGDVDALRGKIEAFLDGRLNLPGEDQLVEYVNANYDRGVIVPRILRLLAAPVSASAA